MKTINKVGVFVALGLMTTSVLATSLDYRTEYKVKDQRWAHRIKLGDSTKAFGGKLFFSIEQKFGSIKTEEKDNTFGKQKQPFWKDVERGDSEFATTWTKKINKHWSIQPGMPIYFADKKYILKPQLKVSYKADFGLTTALRYRHELHVFNRNGGEYDRTDSALKASRKNKTIQQGKWTLAGSYKFSQEELKNLKLSYELDYMKNYDKAVLEDGKDHTWEGGVIVGYQIGDFRPFMELWDTYAGSTFDDHRQLKARAGIKYSF